MGVAGFAWQRIRSGERLNETYADEQFVWRYGAHELGTLYAPAGFTPETENYKEGIVTAFVTPDGSCLVFQRGFMYRIPMLQDSKHVLDHSEKLDAKTSRSGFYLNQAEVWGKVDYASRRPTQPQRFHIRYPRSKSRIRRRGKEFARALETCVSSP